MPSARSASAAPPRRRPDPAKTGQREAASRPYLRGTAMTTRQAPARHAEVAGAGFAGLTVSTALAQRGWSVRLHEQNDSVRDFGAGIVMWRNAMLALEVIDVAAAVREHGVQHDVYETSLNGTSVSQELPGYPYWAIT